MFCEVKTRTSDRFGAPVEAITRVKQQRIRTAGGPLARRAPAPRARPALRCRVGHGRARRGSRDRRDRGRVLAPRDRGTFAATLLPEPAPGVPVAPQLRRERRHDHLVTESDVRSRGRSPGSGTPSPPGTAARAGPRPGRRARSGTGSSRAGAVHPKSAQSTSSDHHDERGCDEEDVAAVLDLLPERVESHSATVAARPVRGASSATRASPDRSSPAVPRPWRAAPPPSPAG